VALLFLPDDQIGEVLDRGRYFPGRRARIEQGVMSACHTNVSVLFFLTGGTVRIATGYALSADGLWRQHSWGVDSEDGQIVETTVPRLGYYGFVLDDTEILRFWLHHMWFPDLESEGAEEVIQFLAQFAGLAHEEALNLIKQALAERVEAEPTAGADQAGPHHHHAAGCPLCEAF
jgi:hypothetical protein